MDHSWDGDAESVLEDLRTEDAEEWNRSVPGGAEKNLLSAILYSAECYSVVDANTDNAHCIFGVVNSHDTPMVWLLGTNLGQRECWLWLHRSRDFYAEFFKRWPRTVCYSDPGNTQHHRWLEWMGYKFIREVPWGWKNLDFKEYRKET